MRSTSRAVLCSILAFAAGCGNRPARPVIVIGVDGMDPGFVERHWAELPNLARLRDRGSFVRLATTTPPQSPVAWSTFSTGLDPEQHGIFDFVRRDPVTMQPLLSMGETLPARLGIALGPYELPLSRPRIVSLRKGKTFWELLADRGIPVTIIHMPANYPPTGAGEELSGMGTPDLRGTQGTFAFYTDDPGVEPGPVSGGLMVRARVTDNHAALRIEGPPNSLRKDHAYAAVTLEVDIDPEQPIARLQCGDAMAIVREGEWSGWIPADFPLIPHLASVRGMFRVYARELRPRLELYVSPVNVDPMKPDLPISAPRLFAQEVARRIGRFSTLGIAEDTAALRQGVFDHAEFLAQSRMVFNDERKLLDDSLAHFHGGFLFFYFSSVDQNSHVLWGQHDDELLEFYRGVDASIGEVARREPAAELMVMSDHGFAPFRRAVNLNTWLNRQGLLAFKDGAIDWTRTKVYAMGLNAVYVNLAGREHFGIVPVGDRDALLQQVRAQLLALRDPQDGAAAVETAAVLNGSGPDLIVGYARGYRASWETGVGGVGKDIIENNDDAWIADHCINPADVPGVLFTSRKIRAADPSLKDLPVSLLKLYGVAPGVEMTGRSVY